MSFRIESLSACTRIAFSIYVMLLVLQLHGAFSKMVSLIFRVATLGSCHYLPASDFCKRFIATHLAHGLSHAPDRQYGGGCRMNLFRKHLQRTPAFTALLALLMAVAIAFCAIGFAAWSGARAQFKQVDAKYTPNEVPRGDAFWTGLKYEQKQQTPLTLQTELN